MKNYHLIEVQTKNSYLVFILNNVTEDTLHMNMNNVNKFVETLFDLSSYMFIMYIILLFWEG